MINSGFSDLVESEIIFIYFILNRHTSLREKGCDRMMLNAVPPKTSLIIKLNSGNRKQLMTFTNLQYNHWIVVQYFFKYLDSIHYNIVDKQQNPKYFHYFAKSALRSLFYHIMVCVL